MAKNVKKQQKYDLNDKKYQWDINEVLDDNERPEDIMKEWYKTKLELYASSKDLYRSAAKLLHWVQLYLKVEKLRTRLEVFLSVKRESNPKATKWKSLSRKYDDLTQKANKKEVAYSRIILKHEKQIKKLLQREELKEYKRIFDTEFFMFKNHRVSSSDKKAIDIMQSDKALDIIQDAILADCRKANVRATDSKGKAVTANSYFELFVDPDPAIRKSSFTNFYWQFLTRRETFTALLYVLSYRATQKARMYNYKTDIHWSMYSNFELKSDQFFQIVKSAKVYKDLYVRFMDHCYGVINYYFKLTQTQPWDYPLINKINGKTYTPEEAKQIVAEAFKCFGPEFSKITNDILHSKLIKWTSDSKERRGSFTIGAQGKLQKEPIQVLFKGDAYSVLSLAHELGHSISFYYSKRNQKTYASLPIVLAEIPSSICELVCALYMWKQAKSNKDIWEILSCMLGSFFARVSKYAASALFKEKLDWVFLKEGRINATDILNGYYYYQKQYQGLPKIEDHWSKCNDYPKWLNNYDIFNKLYNEYYDNDGIMYFIGSIVAWLIAPAIYYGHNKDAINAFLKFIKSGGKSKPLNLLQILKINLLDANTYKYVKENILRTLKFLETFPTINKPGSTRFGKNNKFVKVKEVKKGKK